MEHVFQPILLFSICFALSYGADFLQNPDFEIPPTNLTSNTTSQSLLLTAANSIPGWSFNGTVTYIASGGNGHALQLGQNGKINQTLRASGDEVFDYILSFTLAAQNQDCADNNRTAVNVSVNGQSAAKMTRGFFLQRNYSRNLWERHALYLGQLGGDESVDIEIKSVATNSSCWPVVDAFVVNRNRMPAWYNGVLCYPSLDENV